MILYEPFQFLTADECDALISYAKDKIENGKTLGKYTGRNNRVAWYKESKYWGEWIDMCNSIDPVIDWLQTPQIAFYKPGEYYDWHVDQDIDPYQQGAYKGLTRKISLSVSLNDKSKYEAGDFKFSYNNKETICKELKQKGTVVVFPSFIHHKVEPVKKGVRYSIVKWFLGKSFK